MTKQELSIKKEVIRVGKKEVLKFTLRRVDNGVRLWIKSEDFEKFFKRFKFDDLDTINGNRSYKIPSGLGSTYRDMFNLWNCSLIHHSIINLSYLLSENLSKGLIFIDKGVYTKTELTTYRDEFLKYVTQFYKDYMKPVDFEVSIISNGEKN